MQDDASTADTGSKFKDSNKLPKRSATSWLPSPTRIIHPQHHTASVVIPSPTVKPCCFRVFLFTVFMLTIAFHHFHLSCHEPRNALSQCNPSTLLASKQWLLDNQKHIQRLKKAYQTQVIWTKYTERINERTAKDVGRGMALLGPE